MARGPTGPECPQWSVHPHVNIGENCYAYQGKGCARGGRSADFTGDGVPDILARSASSGTLNVYPHAGRYSGTSTYGKPVLINAGWAGMRWIGAVDLNGDGFSDVVGIDWHGTMRVAVHSGTFDGTRTLVNGLVTINFGWQINDLVFPYDVNGDGFDDILARRQGTGDTYVYYNTGGINGTATLRAPELLISGGQQDLYQGMADVTMDGSPDLVFVQHNGVMGAHSFVDGTYTLGFGWQGIDGVVLTEANLDGLPDVLGRRGRDGALLSYTHTGQWTPAPDRTAYDTLNAPAVVGYNWYVNDIIT